MPSPAKNVFEKTVVRRPAASTHLSASDRYAELPPDKIRPRPHKDIRPLQPKFLVEIMESILGLDLLQTVAVTSDYCLVAGKHRLAAFRMFKELLNAPDEPPEERRKFIGRTFADIVEGVTFSPELIERLSELNASAFAEKFPDFRVPCKILPFSSKDETKVLLGEGIENEKRHDFTGAEVLDYYNRLKSQGFIHEARRPREGERPIMPALALATGKSIRRLQQLINLAAAETTTKGSSAASDDDGFAKLQREIRRALALLSGSKRGEAKQLVPVLEKALKLLEQL